MASQPRLLVAGFLGTLLALGAPAPRLASADGGWWSDLDKGQGVRLADVLENPEPHRGRALTFTCVFHQQEREFNPLRTRFNSERYDNISVWPDGVPLWKQADFERDFPFLYIARVNPQRDALLRLATFDRIELTARIEAVVDGSPFLEVLSARVTGHRLGREVMTLMLRGEVYGRTAGAESQTLAVENFQAALDAAPDLAPVFALRVRARLAEALRNLGRNDEAAAVLAGASVAPGACAPDTTTSAAPMPVPVPVPRGGSLPGEEVHGALAPPASPPASPPAPPNAIPTPRRGIAAPSRFPPPAAPAPLSPSSDHGYVPGEPLRPSLPGLEADDGPIAGQLTQPPPPPPPPPPPRQQPAALPGPVLPAPVAPAPPRPPVVAPVVVDPPLPSPARGSAAPARRSRLSGVK